MVDKGFAKRLNSACDSHPSIPPYGHGRQTWVKEKLAVSHEATRKWFTGESRPRPDKMRELAQTLEVDEAWLSLGITPDLEPRERRARNRQAEGAVNLVTGLIQMNGGSCAFPDAKDPRGSYVDVYAIVRGTSYPIHVSLAQPLANGTGQFNFIIPKEYQDCRILGVVHARSMRVHLIDMTTDMIDQFKVRKGGYYTVLIAYHENAYWSGSGKWTRIDNFAKDF